MVYQVLLKEQKVSMIHLEQHIVQPISATLGMADKKLSNNKNNVIDRRWCDERRYGL